jgi:dipeptidyl aminopeptidase/acylaminoacyl peptidase
MKALISLQVLPDAFATDPDRLARFEREAKTLAALTAVSVEATGPTFRAGTPTTLVSTAYATPDSSRSYDVSPDGQQFLMIKEGSSGPKRRFAADRRHPELARRAEVTAPKPPVSNSRHRRI